MRAETQKLLDPHRSRVWKAWRQMWISSAKLRLVEPGDPAMDHLRTLIGRARAQLLEIDRVMADMGVNEPTHPSRVAPGNYDAD